MPLTRYCQPVDKNGQFSCSRCLLDWKPGEMPEWCLSVTSVMREEAALRDETTRRVMIWLGLIVLMAGLAVGLWKTTFGEKASPLRDSSLPIQGLYSAPKPLIQPMPPQPINPRVEKVMP